MSFWRTKEKIQRPFSWPGSRECFEGDLAHVVPSGPGHVSGAAETFDVVEAPGWVLILQEKMQTVMFVVSSECHLQFREVILGVQIGKNH